MFQKQNLISDDSWTIELVQKFVRLSSAADNFESVYLSFITVLENFLGIKNIAIYDIIPNDKKLISIVKNNLLVPEDKKEIVHFTDEIIGTVARTEISLLIT